MEKMEIDKEFLNKVLKKVDGMGTRLDVYIAENQKPANLIFLNVDFIGILTPQDKVIRFQALEKELAEFMVHHKISKIIAQK